MDEDNAMSEFWIEREDGPEYVIPGKIPTMSFSELCPDADPVPVPDLKKSYSFETTMSFISDEFQKIAEDLIGKEPPSMYDFMLAMEDKIDDVLMQNKAFGKIMTRKIFNRASRRFWRYEEKNRRRKLKGLPTRTNPHPFCIQLNVVKYPKEVVVKLDGGESLDEFYEW